MIANVIVGIPVLENYAGLRRLIDSIERGSVQPLTYFIIDNGGRYYSEIGDLPATDERSVLFSSDRNLGVAASWNWVLQSGLDRNIPVVIANDDLVFNEHTLVQMATALSVCPFVEGDGWALFGQTPECTERVGFYDEGFYPAYHEDVDYDLRLERAGIRPVQALSLPVQHDGWSTTKLLGYPEWLDIARERARAYFIQKWGSDSRNPRWNGHPGFRHYKEPFDGNPPVGWSVTSPVHGQTPLLHEVLNYLSVRLGVQRYLHVGQESATFRRVVAPHKERASRARDVPADRLFDLVLIDGDHHMGAVLDDVAQAKSRLSPHGAIVLHDTNPHTEDMQAVPLRRGHQWTGDAWKAVAELHRELGSFSLFTIPSDYGITLLLGGSTRPIGGTPPYPPYESYADLEKHRSTLLGTVPCTVWPRRAELDIASRIHGGLGTVPVVWDCFLFHDELDLLEIRLETLDPVVERFVLVESIQTFQGKPKPLFFEKHRDRFRRWLDRIVHVRAVVGPETNPWARERAQREDVARGIALANEHDVILLSDVDEIPHPAKVAGLRPRPGEFHALQMRLHPFAIDWEHPRPWRGTIAARKSSITSLQAMREQADVTPHVVLDAGHHFSWLGEPVDHERKLRSFSHTELPAETAERLWRDEFRERGYHVDGVACRPTEIDFSYPLAMQERRVPRRWYRPRKKGE